MDYADRFRLTAQRLIKKYGCTNVTYYQQVEVGNKWENDFQIVEKQTDVIVLPSRKYSRETDKFQGEKDMIEHNYIGYIPYSDFVPKINDSFKLNDVTYTILNVVRINPNGKDIIYQVELR